MSGLPSSQRNTMSSHSDASPATISSLLYLPYNFRHRIYTLAGLKGSMAWDIYLMNFGATTTFKHTFHARNYEGLHILKSFGAKALNSVTRLVVQIQFSPFPHGFFDDDGEQDRTCEITNDALINFIISEWEQICLHLVSHLQPNRLSLQIEIGTSDHPFIEAMLNPLLTLPTLKHCTIDCARWPDKVLQRLVERVVIHATGQATDTTFRFCDLPAEIQLYILGFTALVAPAALIPGKQLIWYLLEFHNCLCLVSS
ncbi:hypothetical protein AJ80_08589 [Polytolypa hystricis UAMH7299]|uniref:Uncharacterized protein n=1 Tax=Polytolypa hystricis (strain UAMH7299) TaxID=1447883 RepID=A0A2B7X4Y1_POLH7|nr:hypothetical protein AJ80_08589 [Polytolypa hystricis UAMH7299]